MSELFVLTERPSVYLASKSERRQELLRQLGVDFEVLLLREARGRRRDIVERPRKDESPLDFVKRMAHTKAAVGWHRMGQRGLAPKPVVGADTEVVLDGAAIGKPVDGDSAATFLGSLSGRKHEVITAVAIRWQSHLELAVSISQVTFRSIPTDEIERYVATGEPLDKAGAYAIQGKAAAFVQHLEGSYSGVMGLPLFETAGMLARIGFPVL
jgi:septum formation protein